MDRVGGDGDIAEKRVLLKVGWGTAGKSQASDLGRLGVGWCGFLWDPYWQEMGFGLVFGQTRWLVRNVFAVRNLC
jgi:hypothetical protein